MLIETLITIVLLNVNPDVAPYSVLSVLDEFDNHEAWRMENRIEQLQRKVSDRHTYRSKILFWDFEGSDGGFSCQELWAWQWGYTYHMSAYSGKNVWGTFGEPSGFYYEDYADWRLESPYITLNAAGACTLSFYHWYIIEYYYDGGNVKVSTDSGQSWSIIYPFEPPDYPCDSANLGNFGIPGEPCFSGDSSSLGWHRAQFLLDDYAGQEILVRWHFGSDGAVNYPGWYIDDVRITNVDSTSGIVCDAGPTAIIAPDTNHLPSYPVNPQAQYRNYGWASESIGIFFLIDSSGAVVFSESLRVVLEPYAETTITFSQWIPGSGENIAYDVIAYTVLSGDQYPLNDTLVQRTMVTSHYWDLLPAPFPLPSSGHSLVTRDDSTYMVFGIHIPGIYLDTTLVYDITTDTWLEGPRNPYGPASYGTANVAHGIFYRIGGTNDFPNPLTKVDIYDPTSKTWAQGMPSPVGLIDHIGGVYKDSLIFTFGNGNWDYPPTNYVSFYDTYTDSWSTATPFPGAGRGACAGGVIDSFAIIAFGYKEGGTFCGDYIVGVIDAHDPRNITWGTWQTILKQGIYRVPCCIDKWNDELWLVCGKITGGESDGVLSFSPYTNVWTRWQAPKPHPVSNVTPVVATYTAYGNVGIFVPSGFHANAYIPEHEVFHTGKVGILEERDVHIVTADGFCAMQNPYTSAAAISYVTTHPGKVLLTLYDAAGRKVRTLVDRVQESPGQKTVRWNGQDNAHRTVAAGIYFLRLVIQPAGQIKEIVDTYKLIFVR